MPPSTGSSPVHILGIRHHGPGSARSVKQALEALQPDAILVEGPPDADSVLPLLINPEMQPPVALLLYAPDQPQQAVYYPFAIFSPEWQALHYGLTHNVPTQFMDLPQSHQFAIHRAEAEKQAQEQEQKDANPKEADTPEESTPEKAETDRRNFRADPLEWLAEAAGYSDGERWWEHMVEQRQDSTDVFAAILAAMTVLRDSLPPNDDPREILREAHMRKTIRAAQRQGYQRIAVICGAWHGPALVNLDVAQDDDALLKGLPKAKVAATWVPWTYGRLARESGYGAGIESPGWYHHLWTSPDQVVIRWLTSVAHLLRGEDLDASTAQVIDAARLAETLAALRDRSIPGLPELNEAVQSTLCFGNVAPMQLIRDKLIVSETMGEVPSDTPTVPLQQDLVREQKRLRLKPDATKNTLDLDLRKPNDLDRSYLLHRLSLLNIKWGEPQRVRGRVTGTFHENWKLQWQPEFAILVIEASMWGNTVREAASAYTNHAADAAPDLPALTHLLDRVLLADLPDAANHLIERFKRQAALASNVEHLMESLPALARVLRYGNVRQTDAGMVRGVVNGLVARICVGLPGACSSLDDDAANAMLKRVIAVNGAISLLQNADQLSIWQAVLKQLADQHGLHGLLAGRCARLLLDAGIFDVAEVARRLGLALSTANAPDAAAAWIEGLLKDSGLILLHDETLWQVIDEWVTTLLPDTFTAILPLLRRTFSTFSPPERRQMGERAKRGPIHHSDQTSAFDLDRADTVLPILAQLLGLPVTVDKEIDHARI